MSEEIEILFQATDEASSVISEASGQIDASLTGIAENTDQASGQIESSFDQTSNNIESSFDAAANNIQTTMDEAASNIQQNLNQATSNVSIQTPTVTVGGAGAAAGFGGIQSSMDSVSQGAQQTQEDLASMDASMQQAADGSYTLSEAQQSAGDTMAAAAAQQDEINAQYGAVVPATNAATSSLKENALAGAQVAASGATLIMGVSNLENAQVSLDRANLTVTKSQQTLTDSQVTAEKAATAVQVAQDALTTAITKYGAGSDQAQIAQQKLTEAQQTYSDDMNKVQTNQDALSVAQERASEAQRNLSNDYMMVGVSVIPTVISGITALSRLTEAWPGIAGLASGATDALGGAMDFLNSTLGVVTIIALLAVGLYEAYEHCAPFRDAVNEIGAVLGGALKTAVDDIYNGLKFLWTDVLVPIADFLKTVFLDALNVVLEPLKLIMDAVNAVAGVGKSIGGFFGGIGKALGLAEGGVVTQPTLAVVGEAGPEAVIPLDESMSDALGDASQGQLNANVQNVNTVNNTSSNAAAPTEGGDQTITIQMQTNPQITISSLSSNASLQDIINAVTTAVNNGMAQPLVDALNRAFAEKQRRRS